MKGFFYYYVFELVLLVFFFFFFLFCFVSLQFVFILFYFIFYEIAFSYLRFPVHVLGERCTLLYLNKLYRALYNTTSDPQVIAYNKETTTYRVLFTIYQSSLSYTPRMSNNAFNKSFRREFSFPLKCFLQLVISAQ